MDREERGMDLGIDGLGLKHIVTVIGLAFAITLAVMIGKRMSAEAMAVVVGIVCGVLASVPASLLLLLVLGRGEGQARESRREAEGRGYPPVVIVQGGTPQALPPGMMPGYWPSATPPPRREFQLVDASHELPDRGESWR
jgi:hypothetical protein